MRDPVVLFSFGDPRRSRNPFTALLAGSVAAELPVRFFTWSFALRGRYDVLHVHWPEALLKDSRPGRRFLRWWAFMALVASARVRRRAVVWTLHNQNPHSDGRRSTRMAIAWLRRVVDAYVVMQRFDVERVAATGRRTEYIPHGHYRDHYPFVENGARRNVVLIGMVRPYKLVDTLVSAFRGLEFDGTGLVVAGRAAPASYGEQVRSSAAGDPRIDVRLGYLDDAGVAEVLSTARLVVLPYTDLYNSGVVLLSLSAGVPVLIPAGPAAVELAGEVGERWVRTFGGPLTTADLQHALKDLPAPGEAPDLRHREWPGIGQRHIRLYRSLTVGRTP